MCEAVADHPSLKAIGAKLVQYQNTSFPGCEEHEGNRYDYLSCMVKSLTNTFWHPCGTCKMGSTNDSMAVVDPELR